MSAKMRQRCTIIADIKCRQKMRHSL